MTHSVDLRFDGNIKITILGSKLNYYFVRISFYAHHIESYLESEVNGMLVLQLPTNVVTNCFMFFVKVTVSRFSRFVK